MFTNHHMRFPRDDPRHARPLRRPGSQGSQARWFARPTAGFMGPRRVEVHPMAGTPLGPLDVTATLTGKRVLFAVATGFVGKVSLSMLLHRYGEQLEKVYVLVRKGSSKNAVTRFYDKVVPSEPFLPIREKYGEKETVEWLKKKCEILDGDITDPWMGMDEALARSLKGQVDVVINCAGLVSFNPSLEVGLNVNTHGVKHLVETCLHLDV